MSELKSVDALKCMVVEIEEKEKRYEAILNENHQLKQELSLKHINVRLNRKHLGSPFCDKNENVGWFEVTAEVPNGINIDKELVAQIIREHADDPWGYIYTPFKAEELVEKIKAERAISALPAAKKRYPVVMILLLSSLLTNILFLFKFLL